MRLQVSSRAYHTQATVFPGMAQGMLLEAGWQTVADHILRWLNARGF
jgi:hypothetical protein